MKVIEPTTGSLPAVRVGRPHVHPAASAHTPGVRQGNEKGAYRKQKGNHPDGTMDAQRSTGINPHARNPIDPRMPSLPPA
jgi:hypothetical protein